MRPLSCSKRLPFMHCPYAGDRSISINSSRVEVILLFGKPEETNLQDFRMVPRPTRSTSLELVLKQLRGYVPGTE